jgi:small subunit ribosomal protein YMR-31
MPLKSPLFQNADGVLPLSFTLFRQPVLPPVRPQDCAATQPRNHATAQLPYATSPNHQFLFKQRLTHLFVASIDHTPHPHPASPTGQLPQGFASAQQEASSSKHATFSSYRDHAQQFGPLRHTIKSGEAGIGGSAGSDLGPVAPPKGMFFDRSELPARFRRTPVDLAEMEAIESGGAAQFA